MQIRPVAHRAGVEIRTTLDAALPNAAGKRGGLYQVFLNLMLNAMQQIENQPGTRRVLTVTTGSPKKDSLPRLQIRFTDTGPGIHQRLWEQVFRLGFTTRVGGSGLGLFIARNLIESMRGRICIEDSVVPLGTTFLIELPTADAGASEV
ncbi:MAG: hypothetical protein HY870_23155 [Chloroflexi bacterium]|nr:hypothetical protein [Chloroflexota bacterium]